jgi:7-dehydrocholesterol reductase
MTKKTEQTKSTWGSGGLLGGESFRNIGSLLIMLSSPPFAILMWYCCVHLDGNISDIYPQMVSKGIVGFFTDIWPSAFDPVAWRLILSFMALQLALMRIVPGPEFRGFATATGHIPVYTENGVPCYLITVAIVFVLFFTGAFDPAIVYDKMGNIISSMNMFSIFFCFFLSFKGLYFPSTKDCGSSGTIISDIFWGTELYPRIFGWDVKQFTNCRFGMMYWQVGIICYAFKQYSAYGFISGTMLVSVLVQSVYIFKFFVWETGYFCSMDIQHDRAGFMLCWGCMVWVPSIYTLHTYFWASHPVKLSLPYTVFLLVVGLFAVWLNYDCDRQRKEFRASNGKMKIWGKDAKYIVAKYTTEDGKHRTSLLLASGWWGVARHFHYIPEITAALIWCSAGRVTHLLPFFYPAFLTLLLSDRAWRDDARCLDKYGEYWKQYQAAVPYKIVPGVF